MRYTVLILTFALHRINVYKDFVKNRSPDQTASAFSLDIELYEAMEQARKTLHMSRSNFIRMCLSKELAAMGMLGKGANPIPEKQAAPESQPPVRPPLNRQ